jgi:hypothetical protein
MRSFYITLILLLFVLPGFAQVNFEFFPEIYGRNIDGLFKCRLINLSKTGVSATLNIAVSERKGGTVCLIQTPEFTIMPGANPIPVNAARGAAIKFAGGKLGQLTGLNKSLPEGDYDYCFTLSFTHSDNPPAEECFSYTLAPFADLNLIDPYNKDHICDKRPLLSWQPLIPTVPGSYYQLVLTEIKTGQSALEALNYNMPVVNQRNIVSPILPYPPVAPELKNQKRYAWQVTAYKDQTILNRSEVWEFMVECQDSIKKVIDNIGYRDIDDLQKGNFYVAAGYIRFSLANPNEEQRLKYEITPINDIDKKIKGLPKIKIVNGLNKITIDLSENGKFVNQQYYVMKIWLTDGSTKSLRFLYQEAKNE